MNWKAIACAAIASISVAAHAAGVDFKRPVYSRENAMICKTEGGLMQAYNAKTKGWRYQPTAGVKTPHGMTTGTPVTPASFDCDVLHDGFELAVYQQTFTYAVTNFGYVSINELRN